MNTWIPDTAPSGQGFVTLLEAFRAGGGTAPGDIVARLLEQHQAGDAGSLSQLINSGQVFGFEWRKTQWIPMFQFNAADLSVAAEAREVRAELPALWPAWTVAMWFALPNARLNGGRPVDFLAADLAAVLLAAQALPSAEDMSPLHLQRTQQGLAAHV